MTDIIFHLLIFFMVATVLKDPTRRFDVPLPDARSGQVAEARGLTIEMTADGAISFNGDLVTQEQLEQQQQPTGGSEGQRSVVFKTDKRLDYDKIIEVMGLYQAAGITDIAVAVKGPRALSSSNASFPNRGGYSGPTLKGRKGGYAGDL